MPTKPLPATAALGDVERQADELIQGARLGLLDVCQRIREFHPRFSAATDRGIAAAALTASDAQLVIAREYGFASWSRLEDRIASADRSNLDRPHHERIGDAAFRRAVDLMDAGDTASLADHLATHPGLVHQTAVFEGGNYFTRPTLLEFAAENPVRHGRLPANIVAVVETILAAGARSNQASLDATLALTCSGRVAREAGVQVALIDRLCDAGADPEAAMAPALVHGEFEAVEALIRRGAAVDLIVAAATNRIDHASRLIPAATAASRQHALALAAQFGGVEIVGLLLDAGADPNRYNPIGCHAHSTPLHQAALAGHAGVVSLLVERGARLDIRDIRFSGTPLGWAEHAGQTAVAAYLRARAGGS